jgi:alpha-glucosidase (family GH31 glycosyl hydrolase)
MRRGLVGLALFLVIQSAVALGAPEQSAQVTSGQVTLTHARFTFITANLVRLEYSPNGKFTDEPTLFAANRSARFDALKVTRDGPLVVLQTDALKLSYQDDGRPFKLGSLYVAVRKRNIAEDRSVWWDPQKEDSQNLGGTLRTLDGCTGPKDLGMGLISRGGWALVDDSGTPILVDGWAKSRPNQAELDWYFFGYGTDYRAALKSLAAISGPVPLPRKNLLGIWYSRYWPYTADDYRQIVKEYSDHGFPLDNIVMDMDWHITQVPGVKRAANGQVWTGYTWDRKLLPDAEQLLQWFHQQGLHVTLNDHPADGVQAHEPFFANFMKEMGTNAPTTQPLPFDAGDQNYMQTFWKYTHKSHEDEGVDFWWLDWQQFPFTKSVADLANLPWLNRFYFLQSEAGGKRGASFSRWGGWGDQKYPIHFSGDANTNWPMLAFEVPFTSTAGNVGCFFWSHDIGGHMGGRNEESYARWCQFGALSAALRSHSTRDATMDRRPWTYPKWAEDSMRVSFQLRAQLMPYIYSSAAESCREMVPLLRPMYFDFAEQEAAYHNAQEYLFGDDLLVAPIAIAGVGPTRVAWQKVWFPAASGDWYDYFTGEKYAGGTTVAVAYPIDQFPLFVRSGTPIVVQPFANRPTSTALEHAIIRCYPGPDGKMQTATLYEDDGQTREYETGAFAKSLIQYRRDGGTTDIRILAAKGKYAGQVQQRSYSIELPCLKKPVLVTVDGDSVNPSYDGTIWTAQVEIGPRSIDKDVDIVVKADLADAEMIHRQALAARLCGLVGKPIEVGATKQMVSAALNATADPETASGILAAAGVTVMLTNDAPYLYNGNEALRVFAAPGVLDSDQAVCKLESGAIPGKMTKPETMKLLDGEALNLASLSAQLPMEDAILIPGRMPHLHFSVVVQGKSHEVSVPTFGLYPPDIDLARSAKATSSSNEDGYHASGAIDGVADGYPGDKRHEWSSNHEKAGATLTLTWTTDQRVSRVVVFDRPNLVDQVTSGRIIFSDGSVVPFGELPNDGKNAVNLSFTSRKIRWLRVEITGVTPTTQNAGLSEIGVFR